MSIVGHHSDLNWGSSPFRADLPQGSPQGCGPGELGDQYKCVADAMADAKHYQHACGCDVPDGNRVPSTDPYCQRCDEREYFDGGAQCGPAKPVDRRQGLEKTYTLSEPHMRHPTQDYHWKAKFGCGTMGVGCSNPACKACNCIGTRFCPGPQLEGFYGGGEVMDHLRDNTMLQLALVGLGAWLLWSNRERLGL